MTDEELGTLLGRTKDAVERKRNNLSLKKLRKKTSFSEEQLNEILSSNLTYEELASKYNVSREQIRYLFKKNKGVTYINANNLYSKEEDDYIIKNCQYKSDWEIAEHLNRNSVSLAKRRRRLGFMHEGRRDYRAPSSDAFWNADEEKFLIQNINKLTYQEISDHLNRTLKAVMIKSHKLKLIKNGSKWSEKEDELLRQYAGFSLYQLAYMLDRTPKAIIHRASYLEIQIGSNNKTSIELKIESILDSLDIEYFDHIKVGPDFNFEGDYVVGDIVIEVNGDYWHGNPSIYSVPNSMQRFAIEKDQIKKEYFESIGYKVITIWEEEIINDLQNVKRFLARLLSDQQDEGSKIGEVLSSVT